MVIIAASGGGPELPGQLRTGAEVGKMLLNGWMEVSGPHSNAHLAIRKDLGHGSSW